MKSVTHKDICPYYENNCIYVGCVCPKYLAYEKVNQEGEIKKQLEKMNIQENDDCFHNMMSIQHHFSSRFFDNKQLSEKDLCMWIKQYDTCIHDEVSEVHEHLDVFDTIYQNKKTNLDELKKEFIDIWHFIMDMFLVSNADADIVLDYYWKTYYVDLNQKTLQSVFDYESSVLKTSTKIVMDVECVDSVSVLILTGHLMAAMRNVRQQINWKHWKKSKTNVDFEKLYQSFAFVLSSIVKCFILVGIDCDNLYRIYVSKNIENIFRQDFGY